MTTSKSYIFALYLLQCCTPAQTVRNVGSRPSTPLEAPEPLDASLDAPECSVMYVGQVGTSGLSVGLEIGSTQGFVLQEGVLVCAKGVSKDGKWTKIQSGTIEGYASTPLLSCEKAEKSCADIKKSRPAKPVPASSSSGEAASTEYPKLRCVVKLPPTLFIWSWIECKGNNEVKLANFRPNTWVEVFAQKSSNGRRQLAADPYCYFDLNNVDESTCR